MGEVIQRTPLTETTQASIDERQFDSGEFASPNLANEATIGATYNWAPSNADGTVDTDTYLSRLDYRLSHAAFALDAVRDSITRSDDFMVWRELKLAVASAKQIGYYGDKVMRVIELEDSIWDFARHFDITEAAYNAAKSGDLPSFEEQFPAPETEESTSETEQPTTVALQIGASALEHTVAYETSGNSPEQPPAQVVIPLGATVLRTIIPQPGSQAHHSQTSDYLTLN